MTKFAYDNNKLSTTYGRLVIHGSHGNNMVLYINKEKQKFIQSFNNLVNSIKKNEELIHIIEFNSKIIEILYKNNEITFALCHNDDFCEILMQCFDENDIINNINDVIAKCKVQ